LSAPSHSLRRVGNETGAQPPDLAPPDTAPAADGTEVPNPAAAASGTDAERPARPSLSPSRAGDFLTCPLLYRFRVIDRLPEPPSPAAARGTLVHAVLERLFDEPAAARTPQAARDLLEPQWQRLVADEPEMDGLFSSDEERSTWLAEARDMLDRYFTLEDPTRLEPRHRELAVEAVLESGLVVRGYVDRLDVAPGGQIRIVDYKTGTAPKEEYEAKALFQMKFYAVVLWLTERRIPTLLQLMYLGNGEIVRFAPDESDLRATVRKIDALWRAIERARATGDWRPRPSRLCSWCAHQAICPAFGGTPPPLPESQPETSRPETSQPETTATEPSLAEVPAQRPPKAEAADGEIPEIPGAEVPPQRGLEAEVPAHPGPDAEAAR
jgi:putative RecB family exonuclease